MLCLLFTAPKRSLKPKLLDLRYMRIVQEAVKSNLSPRKLINDHFD